MKKLRVLVAAVVWVVAVGAGPTSASSAPIVITYQKTCEAGHCAGTTGDGRAFVMDVTGFRGTGKAAQLTGRITVGTSFTTAMRGHASPAGFIVLNGTVTEGTFEGAQVHQRSNLMSASPDGSITVWEGEMRIMPKSG